MREMKGVFYSDGGLGIFVPNSFLSKIRNDESVVAKLYSDTWKDLGVFITVSLDKESCCSKIPFVYSDFGKDIPKNNLSVRINEASLDFLESSEEPEQKDFWKGFGEI